MQGAREPSASRPLIGMRLHLLFDQPRTGKFHNARNGGYLALLAVVGAAGLVLLFLGARQMGIGRDLAVGRPSPAPQVQVIAGSTAKVEQVIGDVDAQSKQPTVNRTASRFGIQGTDLGLSFSTTATPSSCLATRLVQAAVTRWATVPRRTRMRR